jgi:hypothetical protein
MIVLTPGVTALMPCCILTAPGPPDRESHELIERITPDNQRGVMYLLGWRAPRQKSLVRKCYGKPMGSADIRLNPTFASSSPLIPATQTGLREQKASGAGMLWC